MNAHTPHASPSARSARSARSPDGTGAARRTGVSLAGVVAGPVVAGAAAYGAIEVALAPRAADRPTLVAIIAVPVLGAIVLCLVLREWIARATGLARVLVTVAVVSALLVVSTVALAAWRMFLSTHDATLIAAVVSLGAALSTMLVFEVTRPLAAQVRRLSTVAQQVATGNLTAHTGIVRRDEIGEAARALDHMVNRLAVAEDGRQRLERERRFLLSSIGHDLRTPLAALRATVESLQDGVAPDPARYLGAMGTQLDAVEALIDDLSVYARIEAGQLRFDPVEIDLAELVDGTVEAMTPVAHRAQIRLVTRAERGVVVRGGAAELARVLRNLIENAIRYGPPGSVVEVALTAGPHMAQLLVHDEGPGFPDDFRAQAFEPFTRADPARDRTTGTAGLGLAIAHGIVDAHGGTISLGPAAGDPDRARVGTPGDTAHAAHAAHRGATVEVHLPLVARSARRPATRSVPR